MMAIMDRIFLHEVDSQYLSKVTEECGVLRFFSNSTLLYVTEAINLRKKLLRLYTQKDDDLSIQELFQNSTHIQMDETQSALDALIYAKVISQKEKQEMMQNINLWKDYVYLAINPTEFPYVKITDYTEEDWFYIGPFRNRFFLNDLMELYSKLLLLPHCEEKQGPCEKQNNGLCRGWCMLVKADLSDDKDENAERPHIDKLDALLKEAYVHPDNGLLEMIVKEKNKYEDDLQFMKADLLNSQKAILERYKKWLIFLYAVKNLTYKTDKVDVKNGQMVSYNFDGEEHICPFIDIKYRPNEILAVNKNLIDEAWILYQESI